MRDNLLDRLTPAQRSYPAKNGIDPGLLNYRRLLGFVSAEVRQRIAHHLKQLEEPTGKVAPIALDHLLTDEALAQCALVGAPTLSALLSRDSINVGDVVCSIDTIKGSKRVYESERVTFPFKFPIPLRRAASLEFATSTVSSSTTRMQLGMVHSHSYIAQVIRASASEVTLAPLVLGGPNVSVAPDASMKFNPYMYSGWFFETFPEDIDEFAAMREVARDEAADDWQVLRQVPEQTIKETICALLKERPRADWGGEQSDHFSTALHLSGRRTTAAFLLKGPARFRPMTAAHLGKNGDQIYRLSHEPAELLIVQHSHRVTEPVRATLRQFALQPYSSRRWCIMDGPDTYRLLVSAGVLTRAGLVASAVDTLS